jgi:hypothetical protein
MKMEKVAVEVVGSNGFNICFEDGTKMTYSSIGCGLRERERSQR